MEACIAYQLLSDSNHYYTTYKAVKQAHGAGEPVTLLAFLKDENSGWPRVDLKPLAVGGFFRKEASDEEKKDLLSRALENYEPVKPVEHDDSLWAHFWDSLTFQKGNSYEYL